MQQFSRDGTDVVERGGGPAKVQRIDQDARVGGHACVSHDAHRRLGVFHRCPGHELQIGRHAKRLHHLAQSGVVLRQAGFVVIVTGHQNGFGFQGRAHVVQRIPTVRVKVVADADDFQIEHAHAGVALCGQGFAQGLWLVQQVLLLCAGCVGPQAQAHKVVAGLRRDADGLGGRAAVRAEVGEGVDA